MIGNVKIGVLMASLMVFGAANTSALADSAAVPPITAPLGSARYLGPWLEDRLQEMVLSCTPGKRLKMTKINSKKELDVSAVTQSMRNAFDLNANPLGRRIKSYQGKDMINYFANVYQGSNVDALVIAPDDIYLDIVDENSPNFVKAPRVDQAMLIQTCATAMKGALEANVGYSFPIASLKAAIDADYQDSNSVSLNLIKTTFRSPLWTAYTGVKTTSQSPFHAAMTILRWYEVNSGRASRVDNKLLVEFEGAGVTRVSGAKRNLKVDSSASYSLGIPLFGDSAGSTSGEVSWLTKLEATQYQVAVIERESGGLEIKSMPLPSLANAIAKATETADVTLDRQISGDDFTLYNRSPRTLTYVIDRLPPSMCRNVWRVVQNSPALTVGIAKVGNPSVIASSAGWQSCRVPVIFSPNATMSLTNAQSLDIVLEYPILSGINRHTVKLQAETVVFPELRFPHLNLLKTMAKPTAKKMTDDGVTSTRLIWSFTYQLTENGQVENESKIDITGLNTSCTPIVPDSKWIQPSRRKQLSYNAAGKLLVIDLEIQWDGDYETATPLPDFSTCELSGEAEFTLTNGKKTKRPFPEAQFQYPISK
jgi:hypothetical protein